MIGVDGMGMVNVAGWWWLLLLRVGSQLKWKWETLTWPHFNRLILISFFAHANAFRSFHQTCRNSALARPIPTGATVRPATHRIWRAADYRRVAPQRQQPNSTIQHSDSVVRLNRRRRKISQIRRVSVYRVSVVSIISIDFPPPPPHTRVECMRKITRNIFHSLNYRSVARFDGKRFGSAFEQFGRCQSNRPNGRRASWPHANGTERIECHPCAALLGHEQRLQFAHEQQWSAQSERFVASGIARPRRSAHIEHTEFGRQCCRRWLEWHEHRQWQQRKRVERCRRCS